MTEEDAKVKVELWRHQKRSRLPYCLRSTTTETIILLQLLNLSRKTNPCMSIQHLPTIFPILGGTHTTGYRRKKKHTFNTCTADAEQSRIYFEWKPILPTYLYFVVRAMTNPTPTRIESQPSLSFVLTPSPSTIAQMEYITALIFFFDTADLVIATTVAERTC